MKKELFAQFKLFACYLLLLSLLSACGSGGSSEKVSSPPPPPPEPKTVADVWKSHKQGSDTGNGYRLLDYSLSGYLGEPTPTELTQLSPEHVEQLKDANCPAFGTQFDFSALPVFLSSCYGVLPDDQKDDGESLKAAIAQIKTLGGGVLFLPAGQYDFRNEVNLAGIEIDFSNFIMLGEVIDGQNAVRFHLHATFTKNNLADWGDFNLLRFKANDERVLIQDIYLSLNKGQQALPVTAESLEILNVGDVLSISFYNIDNDDSLSRELISPLNPDQSWSSFDRKEPMRWASKITKIDSLNGRVTFLHPFPIDMAEEVNKQLYLEKTISNVGLHHIDFSSSWQGNYCHHGLCGGLTPREIFDMDYGWAGIQVKNVKDSEFSNLSFSSYTFPIETSQTLNISISDVTFKGIPGHQGVILRGWYNVFKHGLLDYDPAYSFSENVNAPIRPTHALTTNGFSIGNVFFDVKAASDSVVTMDFHGRQPAMMNLYDSIENAFVDSKGPIHEMPHAGQLNVFWNIKTMDKALERTENQLVYSWLAKKFYSIEDGYKFHPKSIFVNVSNDGEKTVFLGKTSKELSTHMIHIEGLNGEQPLTPQSLFCAQSEQSRGC